ncbi:acyl-CoA desaturase, partial [Acinetobacter baumannii]
MTSAPLKAPINWTASITLIGLPILAAIIIPIYAYYYDFSVSAWVSLFFLLALS